MSRSRFLLGLLAMLAVVLFAARALAQTDTAKQNEVEYLVPELSPDPYQMSPGKRAFENRLLFSPGVGWVGDQKLFVVRLGYNPNPWLGYEASLGHNPGKSVQALFHTLSVVLRHPLSGRFQPYAVGGFGMMHVFPGESTNASPATEVSISYGGGLEAYLRDDVSIRAELRGVSVLGGQRDEGGTVVYGYREATLGFNFYRTLGH